MSKRLVPTSKSNFGSNCGYNKIVNLHSKYLELDMDLTKEPLELDMDLTKGPLEYLEPTNTYEYHAP